MDIRENISLKKFNTFNIEVFAKYFASFDSVAELVELFEHSILNSKPQTPNIIILGGGSNILFTKDIDGIVLKNKISGIEKVNEDDDFVYIKSGAGVNWHQFVLHCLDQNYAGAENLALIPGNVGASPMQNIGAYGVELKDIFFSLDAFSMSTKEMVSFSKADCGFGYRESVFKNKFKNQFIITSVTYKLYKKPVLNTSYGAIEEELQTMSVADLSIQSVAQAVMNIRRRKLPDPAVIGNAGSFFKNPQVEDGVFEMLRKTFPNIIGHKSGPGTTKLAAGWLIEQCGWKGYRKGDAGCHDKQALVLVNYGNATGPEIYDLSEEILNDVKTRFGINLEREVNIL